MGGIHDVRTTGHSGDRKPTGDALGAQHHVGHDAEVFDREVPARPGHSALNLIRDEDDAVGGAPLAKGHEVAVGGYDEAALTLDRFDDEAGEIAGTDGLLKVGDGAGRGIRSAQSVVERVGIRRMVHVAGERPEPELVRHRLESHRHGQVGATVVGMIEHCDPGATRVLARDLHRVLYRFGAGIEQHGLLREVAGGVLGEQLGNSHVALVRSHGEHHVREGGELGGCCGNDGGIGVPDRHDADPGTEVDELVTVDVHHDRTVGALDEHGKGGRDTDRDHRESPLLQRLRPRSGNRRDYASLGGDRVDEKGGSEDVSHSRQILSPTGRSVQDVNHKHHFAVALEWTGNRGTGTSDYRAYGRDHVVRAEGKHEISGSSDRVFHGDADRWNPEELLIAALSQCHLLSYLHVAASNGVVVTDYADDATGVMEQTADGGGHFTGVTLRPVVTISAGDPDLALSLHHEASLKCFIANSMNFPVAHEPRVRVR